MLGTAVTNRSYVHEVIERRLNSGNPFCYSGSNVIDLPSKFKTYKTVNVLVVCMDVNIVCHFNGRT
jgi:hypothetical protein